MIGKRPTQMPLFEVGNVFDLQLDPGSFHAQLAQAAPRLFADEDFAAFYKDKKGRPSVPPSLLALATLLQHEAGISDEEAIARTAYDLRWAAVLRKEAGQPLCAKSTFQLFRAHLILHPQVQAIFQASIKEARRTGLLKGNALKIAIDTKPITGRGAVQDTFNLLATGIRQLGRALAQQAGQKPDAFLSDNGLNRYTQASLKGSADIDWSDEAAKSALLTQVVHDARCLLLLASGSDPKVGEAAQLLEQLLLQDVEVHKTDDGKEQASIKDGTAKGRIPSATDPEVRHGRKSASKRFNGHKADVAVDQDSQIIVAFAVLSGDAGDASGALSLVEQAETNTALTVSETTGDCAYGGGPTRQVFAEAERDLRAKVPQEASRNGLFAKSAFAIDVDNERVTCPAGHTTMTFQTTAPGGKTFGFGSVCADCPLRSQCTTSKSGRSVSVHPQEARLQAARAYQKTPEGKARLRKRVVVEHRLARLGQLGISQARYYGRAKTRFQLMIACSLANFRWVWNQEARQEALLGFETPPRAEVGSLTACFGLLLALRSLFVPLPYARAMGRRRFYFTGRVA
jgi:Transposase DDE domain/Transposase domain (DUF772)